LSLNENFLFHCNKIPSRPDGDFIDTIHTEWRGQYRRLERHHGYIQWLFPIREPGMNSQQHPLQLHEINSIKSCPDCLARFIKSYELMLDFYGFELINSTTGELKRSGNYNDRMENLIYNSHNWLRITRILKCLGELGFEHLKLGFCLLLWAEARNKSGASMRKSSKDYWFATLRDARDREIIDAVMERKQSMQNFTEYREILQQRQTERMAEENQKQENKIEEEENITSQQQQKENGDEQEIVADQSQKSEFVEEEKIVADEKNSSAVKMKENANADVGNHQNSQSKKRAKIENNNSTDHPIESEDAMSIGNSQPDPNDDETETELKSSSSNHRSDL